MALPSIAECAVVLDRFAPYLLRAAAGSVVSIGLAALSTLAMRRASAAARHGVWLLGFIGALLLPALSAALPGWHVLPRVAASRTSQSFQILLPTEMIADEASDSGFALPDVRTSPIPSTASSRHPENENYQSPAAASPTVALSPTSVPHKAIEAKPSNSSSSPPGGRPATINSQVHLPWTVWLILLWATGTLLALSRVLLGHVSLWLLRRRCSRISKGPSLDLLHRLCIDLGIRRPVELLCTPLRSMPMTWGLWRARLLLPEESAEWPEGQQRDVLLHELGHVLRWDCLTQFLSEVACAMYWFNPLAWLASRRMQVERERACDDLVLSTGADGPSYARHLLASISNWSIPTFAVAGAAVAMARPSTLEERMRAILDAGLSRGQISASVRIMMILLLLAALVPAAALKAQVPEAQQRPSNSSSSRPMQGSTDGAPDSQSAGPASQDTPRGFGGFGGSGGFSGGRSRGVGGAEDAPPPVLGESPTCPLDATLYRLRLPVDRITKLNANALQEAATTPASFEKALAALGTSRPMYRANQSVRLSGDTIRIGSRTPYISNTMTTGAGQSVNTVNYIGTGATFVLAGKATAPNAIDLDVNIEVTALSDSSLSIDKAALKDDIDADPRIAHLRQQLDALNIELTAAEANLGRKSSRVAELQARIDATQKALNDAVAVITAANIQFQTDNIRQPIVHTFNLVHKGVVQPQKPFVIMTVDAASLDKDGNAAAFIGVVKVGDPQSPSAK